MKRRLGWLNVSPFDPVKAFQTRLPGLLRTCPERGDGRARPADPDPWGASDPWTFRRGI